MPSGSQAARDGPDEAARAYYERRAEEELELAQSAVDPDAVAVHYELACLYLDLVHPEDKSTEDTEA